MSNQMLPKIDLRHNDFTPLSSKGRWTTKVRKVRTFLGVTIVMIIIAMLYIRLVCLSIV